MSAPIVLMNCIVLVVLSSPIQAGPPAEADAGKSGTIESYEKAIREAKDVRDEARLRKILGDYYASQEDYQRAADEYQKALSLSPSTFSRRERLEMAVRISWADRLDEAVRVLRSILAEDPKDRDARIQLAKVLSWSDKLNEAGVEADIVLKEHPDDQDALIVKANVLRWQGNDRASIPVYEKALEQGEDFDARIGLAYAHLNLGEKKTAQEIGRTAQPLYPTQERDLARFSDALCGAQTWHLGVPYSYYYDSDKNTVNRAALVYGFRTGIWDTELAYRLTEAKDPVRHERAEDLGITTHAKLGRFDTGAGVGINRTDGGNLFTGQARADTDVTWAVVGVSASREVLTDTAQLIENRIARTSGTLSLSETASPRLSFTERFIYSGYSDGNSSEDLWLSANYAVTLASPKIAAGYRFRYWDFRRQSGSGYFDPENFISQQVYASLYAEKNGYYVYLEPSGGYQSYTRYGDTAGETFFSVFASAGWTMKRCTAFEIYVEGGNYAGGSVAGFNYYQLGSRLTVYF